MVRLQNSAVMPQSGLNYTYRRITEIEFIGYVTQAYAEGHLKSHLGYQHNVRHLQALTGIRYDVCRTPSTCDAGDTILIMNLPFRFANPALKGDYQPKRNQYRYGRVSVEAEGVQSSAPVVDPTALLAFMAADRFRRRHAFDTRSKRVVLAFLDGGNRLVWMTPPLSGKVTKDANYHRHLTAIEREFELYAEHAKRVVLIQSTTRTLDTAQQMGYLAQWAAKPCKRQHLFNHLLMRLAKQHRVKVADRLIVDRSGNYLSYADNQLM